MVMDFGHVKKAIKQAIDAWVDHTLLVPATSPHLTRTGDTLHFTFAGGETLSHTSPEQALCILSVSEITNESIKEYLESRLHEVTPSTITRIHITLHTEPETEPYYHYVHGLKKHDGNCQRIAHGHRSRLRVFEGDTPRPALAACIAEQLNYKYIGTREDITGHDATHTHFAYDAPQGHYALRYPTARCHIIDTDSTVECIAAHIATLVPPGHTVRAYEGVMKGAMAAHRPA
jgi:6-pyruvoyl-tetrahydropterin synthase